MRLGNFMQESGKDIILSRAHDCYHFLKILKYSTSTLMQRCELSKVIYS
ncbi:hypothetical protein SLEP1_g38113 [Rubroshorea leprosula]|uniref:Uncharacterized protein n=1 Tax=Rubroshorea leprosula TaxID=152421 RepID=A0AAV5KX63_9ROSI|nr:hypothetical protein SLEP1_g38113 [Rubroshorea leprosula]